jgi:hypothetical protein
MMSGTRSVVQNKMVHRHLLSSEETHSTPIQSRLSLKPEMVAYTPSGEMDLKEMVGRPGIDPGTNGLKAPMGPALHRSH